jgi:hypothetical protein
MQGFFVGMASAIAPQLLSAVEAFNSIDLSQVGVEIGSWVAVLMNAFSTGRLGVLAGLALSFASDVGANYAYKVFVAALTAAGAAVAESFKLRFIGTFQDDFQTLMVGIAKLFAATIIEKLLPLGEWIGMKIKQSGIKDLQKGGTGAAKSLAESGVEIAKAGYRAFGETGPLIDTTESQKKFQEEASKIQADVQAQAEKARAENPVKSGLGDAGGIVPQAQQAGGAIVSSLAAMGGGYGGAAGPSLIDETRKQTDYLAEIVNNTKELLNGVIAGPDFSEMPTAVLA